MNQPLGGIRVVELATGVAGPYAAKLLADFGADVIKIEPPGGDPARRHGPFPPGAAGDIEQSALFLALNTNKRSLVADPADPVDAALIRRAAATADIVIESELTDTGLVAELRAANPNLVLVSVTPFGRTGPYAGFAGTEIVAYAMGGPMHVTGMADRMPLKLAGNIVQYQCGSVAALAGLAAHLVSAGGGGGTHVDVSNFETQAGSIDRRSSMLMFHQFTGRPVPREGGHRAGLVPAGIYPTIDGYIQLLLAPQWVQRFAALLGDEELIVRMANPSWLADPDLPLLFDGAIYGWTLARTKQECMEEAQAQNMGVTALNAPVDVLEDPHFRARHTFVGVEHPVAGSYEMVGAPFRMVDGWVHRRPAPCLDQHGTEVRAELAAPEAAAAAARSAGTGRRRLPLEGVRVLDLTVVWAGPYATMLLGDLGAEVIRLDNPKLFPTATRGALVRPTATQTIDFGSIWGGYPDGDPGERPWNRVGPFVVHARSKLGATVDLRTDIGRDAFLALVRTADVLIENNSAKVLETLGLDWDVLHAANPQLTVVRMPSLGLVGPYRSYVGFGAHVEALCGLTALRGYTDLDASANAGTYHMDPASGVAAAFATLAALRRREETGDGSLVEFAQAENLLQHIGEYVVDASRTGRRHTSLGNRHGVHAPQGCYPAAGDDRWLVISVTSDDEWAALGRAAGSPPWAHDTRFAHVEGRRRHHDELDQLIGIWTAAHPADEVFRRCQAEGVAAGPVLDEADLLADPHLAARGFFRSNSSPEVPVTRYPGHLWRWDGPEMAWGPVNRMGADNVYVWREVAGLSGEHWQALVDSDQISVDYLDADGASL